MSSGRAARRPRIWRMSHAMRLAGVCCSVMALVTPARAQAPQQAGDRHIDFVGERHQVSGAFGDWTGLAVRLTVPVGASDVWFVEALQRKAFTDVGAYVSGALQHRWNDRWHSFVSVGAGTGEFILPDLRVDASLSRKWGERGALVTTLGTTLVDAKLGYRDAGGYGLLTAYLAPAVVAEAGVRVTRSMPGSVDAARALGALTLGRTGKAYVVVRGSSGEEGYQLLGPGAVERRFTSREGAISWRQWLGRAGGFLVQGERYTNPFYKRTGVSVGIFAHW